MMKILRINNRWIFAVFAAMLLAAGANANEITENLVWEGEAVEVKELGDSALISITNAYTGTIELKVGSATARILAIGGGGGGGGGANLTGNTYCGGGGGGAGGMVEQSGLYFKGAYAVKVGAGGPGGAAKAAKASAPAPGTTGDDTSILQNGEPILPIAKGGGGGGGMSAGLAGGSGGGGSYTSGTAGAGMTGQGNAGGKATSYRVGAGGGGAGAAGTNATAYNQSGGAPGGAGRQSDITGTMTYYAGGGAGGISYSSATGSEPVGGAGGGGNGGSNAYKDTRAGTNGLGGGGGGGSQTYGGGRGGDGGVYILLSNYKPSGVIVPPVQELTYTGEEQVPFELPRGVVASEDTAKTDAGNYTIVLTLDDYGKELGWDDGYVGNSRAIAWSIGKKSVPVPTPVQAAWTYTGNIQTGYVANVDCTFSAENFQTNAGTYTVTASLREPKNMVWADGADDPRSDLVWTMNPQKVAKPRARTSVMVFDGNGQNGCAETDPKGYVLSGNIQTNAGPYVFTATLDNPPDVVNFTWTDDTTDILKVDWSISRRPVAYPLGLGVTRSFIYNGTEQELFKTSPWYEIVAGTNAEIKVGDYICTLHLRYNSETATNVIWADEKTDDATWQWYITPKKIPLPAPSAAVYQESPKGTPVKQTPFTITPDVGYALLEGSDDLEQTEAGIYHYQVGLNDPDNTVWDNGSNEPQEVVWTIQQAENAIIGLKMDDWQSGAPAKSPFVSDVTFGDVKDVKYSYGETETGPWGYEKLTANGFHYVRARLEGSVNWQATEAVYRYCVWTHPKDVFTDFVDVNITGLKGDKVALTISEPTLRADGTVASGLPGFLYSRAGADGTNLRFICPGETKDEDQLLPFRVDSWQVGGSSTLVVRAPVTGGETNFRIYWHTDDPMSDNDPVEGSATGGNAAVMTFGLVNRDGTRVDYWKKAPSVTKTSWEEGEITRDAFNPGALHTGAITSFFVTLPLGAETNATVQTTKGSYRAVFDRVAEPGYELYGGPLAVEYLVVGHTTYQDLGSTADGRILLGNNDTMEGHEVAGQAVYETTPALGQTFWTHDGGEVSGTFPYLGSGYNHLLLWVESAAKTNILWRLSDIRLGSSYPRSGNPSATCNYLPWTETSTPRTEGEPLSAKEVTYLIMRNVQDAAIYSPCYTNGIGTIYFDAVNGFTTDGNAQFVVEVATETSLGEIPTDENCENMVYDDPYFYLTHDPTGNELEESLWKPVRPTVLIKTADRNEFAVDTTQTFPDERVSLAITSGGGTKAFYRLRVTLNEHRPVRFRIRRPEKSGTGGADSSGFILLDNVLVSPPPMWADLAPTGEYNPELRDKQTLGQACAFTRPFPARTDTDLHGRARVTYTTTPGVPGDPATFITSARLNWRWRYLNQRFEPPQQDGRDVWNTIHFNPRDIREGVMTTVEPLQFRNAVGDIEWFYDMSIEAPAYRFVDYSGLIFEKPVGDFTEEVSSVTNRYTMGASERLASCGENWFARLREGRSEWQEMRVVIESVDKEAAPMTSTNGMELVEDNMWRTFVLIPTNASGRCRFRFMGVNRQEGSPVEIEKNTAVFGVAGDGVEVEIPNSGTVAEGGKFVTLTLDHVAGYLEFRFSDKFLTYQVGRAEYQDFNFWNDAHLSSKSFCVDTFDTNSVNVADMRKEEMKTAEWPEFVSTNHELWDEYFEVSDYAAETGRFAKNIFHESHETPNTAWSAKSITFVSTEFVPDDPVEQAKNSGMAGKLLGSGKGMMDYANANAPEGLEKIDLVAHFGQSDAFEAFSYDKTANTNSNYTFFVPVTMSHETNENGNNAGDMAVGASVSLVGYHDPAQGCYEARVERRYKGRSLTMTLYKWEMVGYQWTPKVLCTHDFGQNPAVTCWTDESKTASAMARKYHGFFISLQTTYAKNDPDLPVSTRIVCGLSTANATNINAPWESYSFLSGDSTRKDIHWFGLTYVDERNPFGFGSYGVASKDCPAQFLMPCHQSMPFTEKVNENWIVKDKSAYFSNDQLTLKDSQGQFHFVHDRQNLSNKRQWALRPGRCESFTNVSVNILWRGLRAPTNLVQKLDLYLKPYGTDESNFEKCGSVTVNSYGFKSKTYTLKRTGKWDVRLRTDTANALDVVVDKIAQTKWQAEDIPEGKNSESVFIYTQGVVKDGKIKFQPRRAVATRPVSIRSPLLHGLGRMTFEYDLDTARVGEAEVWVQVATNAVHGNMSGPGGYNESLLSVEPGDPEPVGTWITIEKYRYSSSGKIASTIDDEHNLAKSSEKTVYLGWHDNPDRPVQGIFRLLVRPSIVEDSKKYDNDEYGALTIKRVVCTDEPGYSDRSWRAWNFRTIGDVLDSEKCMNLTDMLIAEGGHGLVGALNNSTLDVKIRSPQGTWVTPESGDAKRIAANFPSIYSPTMKSENPRQGVGSVTFKARVKDLQKGGGRVVLYGAANANATKWDVLATNVVASTVFSNYTWTASNKVYKAVKFEITDPSAKTSAATLDQMVIDEIVIGEKVPPTITFLYARPFRNDLFSEEPIKDILDATEQPLAGESWGVQTQLKLQQLTDEIDVEKGFEVQLSYYRGTEPWGYEKWRKRKDAVTDIVLFRAGEASNLVFRSIGTTPKSLVEPAPKGGEVVQFMLKAKYWDRGGKEDEVTMSSDWQQPTWFYPLDYNADNGGYTDESNFSAYTVLDTVSPGRAWINEVNWNDGTKAENGGKSAQPTNQFIEICIPTGVDMTDWKLRMTDIHENQRVFARFGDMARGIPAMKSSTHTHHGYEFFVLQSPATRDVGGIHYPGEKESAADATWYADSLGSEVSNGTFDYSSPYQFELIRASGIIEHQFVLDGTNTLASYGLHDYDGTNLVAQLNDDGSPKRFYAGRELSRKADRKTFASVGVTGGEVSSDENLWPGGRDTWTERLGFTPGRLNEGQEIPENWFLAPNGTNSWVYFNVETDNLSQQVGEDKAPSILVVVPHGKTTNVTYTVANWYEAAVATNGVPMTNGRTGRFDLTIKPSGLTYVTASAMPQRALAETFGLDETNPYSTAILEWLKRDYPDASAEDIRLARFRGLSGAATDHWLTLKDMYWMNIPPVPQTEEERQMNNGTNWWLRGCINWVPRDHIITRTLSGGNVIYTNKQVDVTLYMTNACTHEARAPRMLRNAKGESSENFAGGVWDGPTMKISGTLKLAPGMEFLPFRLFTFNPNSFTDARGNDPETGTWLGEPYTTTIDILDPAQSPIGRNYGWHKYPLTNAYFRWEVNDAKFPYTTEPLKANSTYPDKNNE